YRPFRESLKVQHTSISPPNSFLSLLLELIPDGLKSFLIYLSFQLIPFFLEEAGLFNAFVILVHQGIPKCLTACKPVIPGQVVKPQQQILDRKSTRLNSSHVK